MKHRQRVEMALNHEIPDRCPMQISFTPEFALRLQAELGMGAHADHNPHGGGNTYALERLIDEDLILTSVGWANSYYLAPDEYTDEWGVGWKSIEYHTPYGVGRYTEFAHHPLAEDHAIASYIPPNPSRPELYTEAERVIHEYRDEYWIVGVVVTTIFETAWALRGYERMLMDFALEPELADQILEIPFRYHLAAARKLVELGVDMVWLGDDIGAQKAMLISPAHWRRFLKPRLARIIAELKQINPQVKVAYHSDGNIYPVIPELIEIGLDVLNPVQPASMDPERLKREFGRQLCFWGSIDEQHTLPFGAPQDVRREVLQRLTTLGRGGGLILGPTHHVQLDTPMQNFWAMVNTICKTEYATVHRMSF
jgi:uroporphyrinogen decarboxylase